MAHTLYEQNIPLDRTTSPINTIIDLFVKQFGYTKNNDYYFSPVDNSFGIRIYDDSNHTCIAVTFDGGESESIFEKIYYSSVAYYPYYLWYQVSKSEKVILLRFAYCTTTSTSYPRTTSFMIAHDDKNKTVCFKSDNTELNNTTPYHNVYMIDSRKVIITISNTYSTNQTDPLKVNKYLSNTIYRYPSHANLCNFSELYGVCSLNGYDYSYLPSYISFNDTVYRIVSLSNNAPTSET